MAELETDRGYVDEAQEAPGGFVVACGNATGVIKLVEAALHKVAQSVEDAIYGHALFAGLAHGDDWHHVARFHGLRILSES